jgi:hypothetical protein
LPSKISQHDEREHFDGEKERDQFGADAEVNDSPAVFCVHSFALSD